jgi:hypothetical protein
VTQWVNDLNLPPGKSQAGQYWSWITRCWSDSVCWRPRTGEFPQPWPLLSKPLLPVPAPIVINKHLWDIADQRAVDLYQHAQHTNKKIAVLWSGGIDSTFVLISLLRNIPITDHSRLVVYLNQHSILENIDFFVEHIDQKIEHHYTDSLNINNEWLGKHLCVSGEGGDSIFGRILPALRPLVNNARLHTHYRDNTNDIVALLSKKHDVQFCSWFVRKINRNLSHSAYNSQVHSLLGWMWWVQYNFIFETKCFRPLMLFNKDNQPIASSLRDEYQSCIFFADTDFQLWSFSNHGGLYDEDGGQHKEQAKQYIYDYDKNKTYRLYKRKTKSQLPTLRYRFYDRHWVGSNKSSIDVNECLEQFLIN